MKKNTINICFSSDNNYIQHLAVSIVSILKNRQDDEEFSFLILDGNISEDNKEKLRSLKSIQDFDIDFVKVDNALFSNCPIQDWTHLSIVTYYRLVLPDIKPEWDRIIYLDCDIIVQSSLKELFTMDMQDNYFAAVTDISSKKHARRLGIDRYFNTGVMLIDAKKWRNDDITNKLFDWIDKNQAKILLHDQDILNCALADHILSIDNKWNTLYMTRLLHKNIKQWEKASIIHFADKKKPWLWYNGDVLANKYLYYLQFTPFKDFIKSYRNKVIPKSLFLSFMRFLFDIGNFDETTKYLRIIGFTFYFQRKTPKCQKNL